MVQWFTNDDTRAKKNQDGTPTPNSWGKGEGEVKEGNHLEKNN